MSGRTRVIALVALAVVLVAIAAAGVGIAAGRRGTRRQLATGPASRSKPGAGTQSPPASSGPMPLPAGSPPPPRLHRLLPFSAHVRAESWVRLHGEVPQIVVVDTEPSGSPSGEATDLVLCAWDRATRHWSDVFDAATTPAPATGGTGQDAVLPSGAAVSGLRYTTLHAAPGRVDLAFWAGVNFGADAPFDEYIVHFDGRDARIAYAARGESGTARVVGEAPHQELSMHAAWVDPVDPECCAVRDFTQVVGWLPASGSTPAGRSGYGVVKDTRSWMGVYLATRAGVTSGGAAPPAVVLSVVPGSPAAGLLEPGDELVSVVGAPPRPQTSLLGPPVVDQVDAHRPGAPITLVVARGGKDISVHLTLSDYANPDQVHASPPAPGYFGASVVPHSAASTASTKGALVSAVASGGAAAAAGLEPGDVVTSLGATTVTSGRQLQDVLLGTPAGTVEPMTFVSASGKTRTGTADFGPYPSGSGGTDVVPPLVDEL